MTEKEVIDLIGQLLNEIDNNAGPTPAGKAALGQLAGVVFGSLVRIADALETLAGRKS